MRNLVMPLLASIALAGAAHAATEIKGAAILDNPCGKVAVKQMGIRRFKLIQHSHEDVEFRYVMQQPGTGISCEAIQNIVYVNMSPLFRVRCDTFEGVDRADFARRVVSPAADETRKKGQAATKIACMGQGGQGAP